MTTLPTFAAATRLINLLRGFDLDDDQELLSAYEKIVVSPEVTPEDWQFLGVLRYRAGQWDSAAAAFEQSSQHDKLRVRGRYLAAYSTLRAGDAPTALAAFDLLAKASSEDEEVSGREIDFARGDALWVLGRLEESEQAYKSGLKREPSGGIWLDVSRLRLRQRRPKAALRAVDRALKADEHLHEAIYLRASLLAKLNDVQGALKALESAVGYDRAYAKRARKDKRFISLRGHPEFQKQVAPPRRKNLRWLDQFAGLAKLRDDPRLKALGVRWVNKKEAREGGKALQKHYAGHWHLGVLWSDEIWAACQEMAHGKQLLAECPAVLNRNGASHHGQLYVDTNHPEQLLFAPSFTVPPVLWIPMDATAEAIHDVLREFYPVRRVARSELTHVRRAFMGYMNQLVVPNPYSGQLEQAGPHELDRHWTFSPYVDSMVWGTAYHDDPWPERIPPQPAYMVKITARSRKVRAQREGGVCGLTRRTLFSRAHLTMEIHQKGLYVWNVRYRPCKHSMVIEAFNQRFGSNFPTDLPLDVVGAMVGFGCLDAETLEKALLEQTESGMIVAYLRVLAAVLHGDLRVTHLLRRYLDHGDIDVRGSIANLCVAYEWEFVLEDLGIKETHPDLLAFIESVLQEGIQPPQFNDMGEPVDLYRGDSAEEDEATES